MFDLHSHIIPGIDDGAKDMEMSLAMLQIAVDNGTRGIVATPHVIEGEWLPTWSRILADCDTLQKEVQKAGMEIPIYPGGEVAIHIDILDKLKGPGAYCINSGRYMLVELPATHIPNFADEFFFTLQARGITPILAHPERHPELTKKPEILGEWINRGVLVQVNGTSITGRMGERVMKIAELFLTNGMVHVLGSDAHRTHNRNTNLTSAVTKMVELLGKQATEKIVTVNANHIIHNREINITEVGPITYPRENKGVIKWLSKWWK